jgi:hypothetical protein
LATVTVHVPLCPIAICHVHVFYTVHGRCLLILREDCRFERTVQRQRHEEQNKLSFSKPPPPTHHPPLRRHFSLLAHPAANQGNNWERILADKKPRRRWRLQPPPTPCNFGRSDLMTSATASSSAARLFYQPRPLCRLQPVPQRRGAHRRHRHCRRQQILEQRDPVLLHLGRGGAAVRDAERNHGILAEELAQRSNLPGRRTSPVSS